MKLPRLGNDWARRVIDYESPEEYERLLGDLGGDPARKRVLGGLAQHKDPIVRAWVADHAAQLLGPDGSDLVWKLVADPDPDVRDVALETLATAYPESRAKLVKRLHRQVLTRDEADFHGPLFAIWKLVEIGDPDLPAVLRALQADPVRPWHRWAALAAEIVVTRDEVRLVRLLGIEHDHDATRMLMSAAIRLPTPSVIAALERCATDDSEADCRKDCAFGLREISAQG